jgi:hypothetical protein
VVWRETEPVNPPDRTTAIVTLPVALRATVIGEPVAVR